MDPAAERKRQLQFIAAQEEEERARRTRLESAQTAIRYEPPTSRRIIPQLLPELNDIIVHMLPSRALQRLQLVSRGWYEMLRYVLMKRGKFYWVCAYENILTPILHVSYCAHAKAHRAC